MVWICYHLVHSQDGESYVSHPHVYETKELAESKEKDLQLKYVLDHKEELDKFARHNNAALQIDPIVRTQLTDDTFRESRGHMPYHVGEYRFHREDQAKKFLNFVKEFNSAPVTVDNVGAVFRFLDPEYSVEFVVEECEN